MQDNAPPPPLPDKEQTLFESSVQTVGASYAALSLILDYELTPAQNALIRKVMTACTNWRTAFKDQLRKLPRVDGRNHPHPPPSGGGGFAVHEKPHVAARRFCGYAYNAVNDWLSIPNRMTEDQRALSENLVLRLSEIIEADMREYKPRREAKPTRETASDSWTDAAAEQSATPHP